MSGIQNDLLPSQPAEQAENQVGNNLDYRFYIVCVLDQLKQKENRLEKLELLISNKVNSWRTKKSKLFYLFILQYILLFLFIFM